MPTHLCAAAVAFVAFSVSLIIGLLVNNPFVTVVLRSLFALMVFYFLGLIIAGLGQMVIIENFNAESEALIAQAVAEHEAAAEQALAEKAKEKSQEQQPAMA